MLCNYFKRRSIEMTAETARASTVHEPLGKEPLWHTPGLKLPAYVQHLAHDLLDSGHASDRQQAIAMAVGIIRKWSRGIPVGGERKVGSKLHKHLGKIHPDVRAAAVKAMQEWETARARAHAHAHEHSQVGGTHVTEVDLTIPKHPRGSPRTYEAGRKTGEAGQRTLEGGARTREQGAEGRQTLDQLAQHHADAVAHLGHHHPHTQRLKAALDGALAGSHEQKSALVHHLRNVHRLKGSHEQHTLSTLHNIHANDHTRDPSMRHRHGKGLHSQARKTLMEMTNSYGEELHYDPFGRRIDLARPPKQKAGQHYVGFEKLVQRLMAQGKSEEEAHRIASFIGRKKYGAGKFQAMAARGRRSGAA